MWGRFDAGDPAELASSLALVLGTTPHLDITRHASTSPSELSVFPAENGFVVAVRGAGSSCFYGRFRAEESSRYGMGIGDCEARLRAADSVDEPLRFPTRQSR
jgi:hypothetical protein